MKDFCLYIHFPLFYYIFKKFLYCHWRAQLMRLSFLMNPNFSHCFLAHILINPNTLLHSKIHNKVELNFYLFAFFFSSRLSQIPRVLGNTSTSRGTRVKMNSNSVSANQSLCIPNSRFTLYVICEIVIFKMFEDI